MERYLRANAAHFLGVPAQAYYMYEPDDESSYRLVPGWRGEQTVDKRTTEIVINSRGMRGTEIEPKQPGETRILMLGDSYVFGHGVAEDETIAVRLQARLQVSFDKRIRVLNGGIPGQGLRDQLRNFERYRDLAPDLVIACTYLGNDFTDDCRVYTAIADGFLLKGPLARATHTSIRFRLTMRYRTLALVDRICSVYAPSLAFDRSQLLNTPEEIESEEHFPDHAQRLGCLYFDRRADDQLVTKILGRCRSYYGSLRKLAGDVPVLYVLIPGIWHVNKKVWRRELEGLKFDPTVHGFGLAQRRLLQLAEDMSLEMIDLTKPFTDAENPKRLWFKTDRHITAEGADFVAEQLHSKARQLLGK